MKPRQAWLGLSAVFVVRVGMLGAAALAAASAPDRPDPAAGPATAAIDLSHWKLTLPVDNAGTDQGSAAEVWPKDLARADREPFFRRGGDGSIVFWCPVGGATTQGSDYPPSELREMLDPTDDNVNWPAKGNHLMEATCRVLQTPSSQKVIIGQIHGFGRKAKPLVKLQFSKGRIEALVKVSPSADKDRKLTFGEAGLNRDVHYAIRLRDGLLEVTVAGQTQSVDIIKEDAEWGKASFYFKAGAYCQDNDGPASEGARVRFSRLNVRHDHRTGVKAAESVTR